MVGGFQTEPRGFSRLEERLEVFERARLGSELIIFGTRESPSEKLREVVTNIDFTIGVATASDDIEGCFRIRANGDRPRPIVVKLSSSGAQNRWLAGKRFRGVLDGLEIPDFSSGTVEVNKRLTTAVRAMLVEARRAVGNAIAARLGALRVCLNQAHAECLARSLSRVRLPALVSDPPPLAPVLSAFPGMASRFSVLRSGCRTGLPLLRLRSCGEYAWRDRASPRCASRSDLGAILKNPRVILLRNK